jgi:hydrogenase maturation protease
VSAAAGALVVGFGNPLRGDDAAGLEVAARVRDRAPAGVRVLAREAVPVDLFEAWDGSTRVVLVDAARGGGAPGTVRRLDAATAPLPASLLRISSHTGGVAEAVELARALGRLPAALAVYAIEGATFEPGAPLDPAVARAVEAVARAILDELAGLDAPAGRG